MHKLQNKKHQQEEQGDHGMPKGKATYGSKRRKLVKNKGKKKK